MLVLKHEKTMNNHIVKNVCKIGQREKCCKYLVMSPDGFECMKVSESNKKVIDDAWAKDEHVAQGDNCDGKEDIRGDS